MSKNNSEDSKPKLLKGKELREKYREFLKIFKLTRDGKLKWKKGPVIYGKDFSGGSGLGDMLSEAVAKVEMDMQRQQIEGMFPDADLKDFEYYESRHDHWHIVLYFSKFIHKKDKTISTKFYSAIMIDQNGDKGGQNEHVMFMYLEGRKKNDKRIATAGVKRVKDLYELVRKNPEDGITTFIVD